MLRRQGRELGLARKPTDRGRVTVLVRIADGVVRGYQLAIRPLLPAACRFEPSCSQYARLALAEHGFLRGSWLTVKRHRPMSSLPPGGL